MADFKAIIEDLNSVDPGSYAFQNPIWSEDSGSDPGQLRPSVLELLRRLDALLELLDSTADALAATWDLQNDATLDSGSIQ